MVRLDRHDDVLRLLFETTRFRQFNTVRGRNRDEDSHADDLDFVCDMQSGRVCENPSNDSSRLRSLE